MKKKLTMCLSVALIAVMVICGTLAYLTSEDGDVNVMTLGNVKIAQHEYQRAEKENGTFETGEVDGQNSYVLEAFEQGKPLLPIVGDPNEPGDSSAYAGWDATPVRMTQVDSYGNMQVFAGKNAQDKFVTVENTGKTDAYVRTIVAIEVGSANTALIGTSHHDTWTKKVIDVVAIDENNYLVMEYVYAGGLLSDGTWRHKNGILPAEDTTYPNLSQVYLKHNATNEDCEAIDGNGNGTLDILVLSQAVQAAGFDNAQTALDTAFGTVKENVQTWLGVVEFVTTAEELGSALEESKSVAFNDDVTMKATESNAYGKTGINIKNGQTIDGLGNTLKVEDATTTWDSAINTTGGTIKNLTIAEGFRGIFVNHNSTHSERVILENVTIDGPVYTISCDQGTNQGLTATNSTFNGWTSYAATIGDVVFEKCNFGEGSGYSFCRPYAPTEFVGCEFEAGFEIDPRAAVTFEDCTIGGVALTADNLATLVTSNITNATVK